jgi:DNA-directed RNA polymerase alpha subunit
MISNFKYSKDYYDYELSFNIKGIDLPYINYIRRTITNKTQGYTLGNFKFIRNNSFICNEIIEHRLSMIPIYTKKETKLVLNEINESNEVKSIYTDNIKTDIELPKNIEICRLKKGEEVYCNFDIIKGFSEEHAKFKPITTCYFYKKEDKSYDFFIESNFDNLFELFNELITLIKKYNEEIIRKFYEIKNGENIIKILNNEIPIEYTNIFCKELDKNESIKFINYYRKFYSDDYYVLKLVVNNKDELEKKLIDYTNKILTKFTGLINELNHYRS